MVGRWFFLKKRSLVWGTLVNFRGGQPFRRWFWVKWESEWDMCTRAGTLSNAWKRQILEKHLGKHLFENVDAPADLRRYPEAMEGLKKIVDILGNRLFTAFNGCCRGRVLQLLEGERYLPAIQNQGQMFGSQQCGHWRCHDIFLALPDVGTTSKQLPTILLFVSFRGVGSILGANQATFNRGFWPSKTWSEIFRADLRKAWWFQTVFTGFFSSWWPNEQWIPFCLLNDKQMSNKVGVEHQPFFLNLFGEMVQFDSYSSIGWLKHKLKVVI